MTWPVPHYPLPAIGCPLVVDLGGWNAAHNRQEGKAMDCPNCCILAVTLCVELVLFGLLILQRGKVDRPEAWA